MERPSDHWQGFATLTPDSDKYKRIRLLLSSANFEYLKTRGTESRRGHQPDLAPHVTCSVNLTHLACGFNNLVLELAFSDNVCWIARIPHQAFDDGDRTSMLSEIATMRIIQQQTTIPIPRVFDFDTFADQPFGYPYVFIEYLGGRPFRVGWRQPYLTNTIAKSPSSLQTPSRSCPWPGTLRLGPWKLRLNISTTRDRGKNREIIAMHPDDPGWLTACWVLKTALTHIIIEDRVRGPFPLCHLDLHLGNMLFDSEYNLTGIIDWSSAQAAPLEQLSVFPEFVTFPGLSDDENRPIVELKNLVVESIRERERDQEKRPPLDDLGVDTALHPNLISLSTYMASESAEVTYRQYMASPRGRLWAGKMVAKLIYGKSVTWEQLREVYGTMPLF
ncbi:hypothetical protein QBC33DRAFT_610062 [Phialemonium atrogriseum]|uniref:Aminoglycoside phosphotransferase domain-containing protein n=1 Tax=Phialemonium atrogriseum TaxID=1093897 RepID=A0AAJ0C201_9PEZI|nr:uncharacterized protein QBC33DRAFT_610062 [Phialemonium atrogriseum]KAK1768680.1 hypothetical protein QBC33DRAFT_610062 [Phialemonium atrogriseum]